jgi:hypothetical protein
MKMDTIMMDKLKLHHRWKFQIRKDLTQIKKLRHRSRAKTRPSVKQKNVWTSPPYQLKTIQWAKKIKK